MKARTTKTTGIKRHQQDEDDISDRIRDVSDVVRHRSFVLYGRSGTGKTTLAASFPKPILLLDVKDEGTDSVVDVKGIKVFDVTSFEDFELAYYHIERNPKKYKTIIIDTVSQVQQLAIKELMDNKKTMSGRSAGDWGSMKKRDWGDVSAMMKEWLINYRDLSSLGLQVVFIAQDRSFNFDDEVDDESSVVPEIGPALMPSVMRVLNAAVQMIGNTFIRERFIKKEVGGKIKRTSKLEYCLKVGPDPVYITKIRKPRSIEPPKLIVDPSYEDIVNVIKGE